MNIPGFRLLPPALHGDGPPSQRVDHITERKVVDDLNLSCKKKLVYKMFSRFENSNLARAPNTKSVA